MRRMDVSEVSKTDTGWRGKKVTEGNFLLSRCVADKVGGPVPEVGAPGGGLEIPSLSCTSKRNCPGDI